MKKSLNSRGFTAVEALLIILILTVIGFGGYYVWHTQHKETPTAATSAKPMATTPPTSAQHYVLIREWGVRAPYNGTLQLSYKIVDGWQAVFSAKSLTDLYAGCEGFAGTINRYNMAVLQQEGADGPFGAPGNTTKIIGNYGYAFDHAQSECSGSIPPDQQFTDHEQQIFTELVQANDAVKSLVENLQAAP